MPATPIRRRHFALGLLLGCLLAMAGAGQAAPQHTSTAIAEADGLGLADIAWLRRDGFGKAERILHALLLEPQHDHDVASGERGVEVLDDAAAGEFRAIGQQRRGAADADLAGTERGESVDV